MQFYLSIISNKARRRGQRILVKLSNVSSHSTVATIYIHVLSCLSGVRLLATPWTVVCQASQSMGFSRQEYWSGLPCPPPGDLPSLGIKPTTLMSLALAGVFFTTSTTREAHLHTQIPQRVSAPLQLKHTEGTTCHLFLSGRYDNSHLRNDI